MNDIASAASALTGQEASAAPAEATQTGNAPWYGDVEGDLGGYIENKGWQSSKDVANSYRNLEKLFGADKAGNTVMMPKEDDADGWNELYGRLGRPGEASQYKIEAAEGADEQAIQWFKDTAFAQGLSQSQAQALFSAVNERAQTQLAQQSEQSEAKIQEDLNSLKSEWGQTYDANINAGRRAAERFGFSEEDLGAMESALGTKGLLEKMANIGKAMGEDKFESGNKEASFGLSPAQAQQQIGELKGSVEFQKTYLDPQQPGHQEAVQKMQRLMAAAYPGGA